MKILFSISNLLVGGAQTSLIRLAISLSKRHSVYIYDYSDDTFAKYNKYDNVISLIPHQKIRVIRLPYLLSYLCFKVNAILRRLRINFDFWMFIKKAHFNFIIFRYGIQIVNSHLYHSDKFTSSCLKSSRTPLIITDHGDYRSILNTRNNITLNRDDVIEPLKRADLIITPCEKNRELMSCLLDNSDAKCKKIYYGLHIPSAFHFNEDKYPKNLLTICRNSFVFGMVARGIEEKGWEEAIKAFQELQKVTSPDRPLVLICAGSSEYLTQLENGLKLGQESNNIYFVGHVTDPFHWINLFDVGLLPTHFSGESLPNSVIEYMAMGKPTIATAIGGIPEMLIVNDKHCGTLVTLNEQGRADISEIIKAMLSYVENSDLLIQHSRDASLMVDRFNILSCESEYENVFNNVMSSRL